MQGQGVSSAPSHQPSQATGPGAAIPAWQRGAGAPREPQPPAQTGRCFYKMESFLILSEPPEAGWPTSRAGDSTHGRSQPSETRGVTATAPEPTPRRRRPQPSTLRALKANRDARRATARQPCLSRQPLSPILQPFPWPRKPAASSCSSEYERRGPSNGGAAGTAAAQRLLLPRQHRIGRILPAREAEGHRPLSGA